MEGSPVNFWRLLFCVVLLSSASGWCLGDGKPARSVVIVVGSEGAEEYGAIFRRASSKWVSACKSGGIEAIVIGLSETANESDVEVLEKTIKGIKTEELWLVMIGHGTFDGREAKFNLRGPDFTDKQLAEWLKGYVGELTVINTASASGSYIPLLSGPNRIIISATKSPNEIFFAHFGAFFAEAIGGKSEADLDNDKQVSLLESFLYAVDQVESFYQKEGRIATEHALIDDNGDGLGTRADWFEGTTAIKVAKDGAEPDGERAMQKVLVKNEFEKRLSVEQIKRRDELERKVRALRRRKEELASDAYYADLEKLLLELAKIYREVEKKK